MAKFKVGDKVKFTGQFSTTYNVAAVSRVSLEKADMIIYRIEDHQERPLWPWYPEEKFVLVALPKKLYRVYKDVEATNEEEARAGLVDGWNVEAR